MHIDIIDANLKWANKLQKRNVTDFIVLHHAAGKGTIKSIHSYHLSLGWAGIAYHFYVRQNGEIYGGRPIDTVGGHCKGNNYNSIGICFEGNFDNEKMSEIQFKSGVKLLAYLISQYPNAKMAAHCELLPTSCPGKNFDYNLMEVEAVFLSKNKDFAPTECHRKACEWCINNDIFSGDKPSVMPVDDEEYHWHDTVTREELATVIYKICKKYLTF